ncbi:hypothetical protein [Streptomyces sp. H39-C1]|uniref:hypothetical protein n=1 Tax=Streptomyces sp. H39-C1 TaxID=3004355 RepID=UPI0022AEF197|nr:hypothetical protein [Streptomyces sp. H39-C1]MCZ4097925.1 hypothetical protein [Streptomyces sp. H39-C1]
MGDHRRRPAPVPDLPDEHAAFVLRKNHLDAYAELEGAEPAQWAMYGGLDQANPESWHASFTSATPPCTWCGQP